MPSKPSASFHPFVQICENLLAFTQAAATRPQVRIATLGPPGTSSEYAASRLAERLALPSFQCILHPSYEEAAESVIDEKADLLLAANAYAGINRFYISDFLRLTTFFVLDTLPYGLASRQQKEALMSREFITIASHSAPAHLADALMKGFKGQLHVERVQSTSEAARLAAENRVDACITNDQARSLHALQFISPVRSIQMAWSVFKRDADASFPSFNSLCHALEHESHPDH